MELEQKNQQKVAIQIQHLLKLNRVNDTDDYIYTVSYSNTTLVKVKYNNTSIFYAI